jgi:pSer/pThr/pTyr-binding forkhead associated (FHA) protein
VKLFELLWDAREGAQALDERHGAAWLIDDRIYSGLASGDNTATAANLPSAGAEVYPLAQPTVVIGSAPGMDLQLTSTGISARHAALERRPGGIWVVSDLSTNGTTVNGVRVPGRVPLPISPGSVLGVGQAKLRLTTSAELLEALGPLIAALPASQPLPEGTNLVVRCESIGSALLPEGQQITLGRAKDAGLTLPHPNVSRYHVGLTRRGDRVEVEDLGSSNGTYVNNVQISGSQTVDPDMARLSVGPFDLSIHAMIGEETGDQTTGTQTLAATRRIKIHSLKGELEVMPLRQLVQSIELNGRSGRVKVETGQLVFWEGRPVWATWGDALGSPALQALLSLESGEFTFDPVDKKSDLPQAPAPEAGVVGSFTGALLEHSRQRDESH